MTETLSSLTRRDAMLRSVATTCLVSAAAISVGLRYLAAVLFRAPAVQMELTIAAAIVTVAAVLVAQIAGRT